MTSYTSAITGFRTGDLDLVWFGGLSGVQARLQTTDSIVIAQRDIDKEFKSAFIVNKKHNLKPITNLEDLVKLKDLKIHLRLREFNFRKINARILFKSSWNDNERF